MKSKIAKRLLSAVLALALTVGLLSSTALAADPVVTVHEKTGNDGKIVVTVYDQVPGVSGDGSQQTPSGTPVKNVGINALRIGSVVELTSTSEAGAVSTQVAFGLTSNYVDLLGLKSETPITSQTNNQIITYYFTPSVVQQALEKATQSSIESFLDGNGSGSRNEPTNGDGIATFDNLQYGLYLLAKSSLPADATTDLVPFLVSVPMYVTDAWTNTVYAYPKVRTAGITIAKTLDDHDTVTDPDIHVNSGQTLAYTVTATIPASKSTSGTGSANEFIHFAITDTNTDSTLNIDEHSVAVSLNGTTLHNETDYERTYDGAVLTITLEESGLETLNGSLNALQTLTLTYNAVVATDVSFSTKLINKAKVTYQRSGMTTSADTSEAENTLYTYGIELTKSLSDGSQISPNEIAFELYQGDSGDAKIPVALAATGGEGYWQTDSSASSYTMHVDATGKLYLYGLEPGTYRLKETATMDGYALLKDPIVIVISDEERDGTATATVNDVSVTVTDGIVPLAVENTKNNLDFTLPQTGGAGTLMATAIGLGLLCAGVILLIVYRRKGQKNS